MDIGNWIGLGMFAVAILGSVAAFVKAKRHADKQLETARLKRAKWETAVEMNVATLEKSMADFSNRVCEEFKRGAKRFSLIDEKLDDLAEKHGETQGVLGEIKGIVETIRENGRPRR